MGVRSKSFSYQTMFQFLLLVPLQSARLDIISEHDDPVCAYDVVHVAWERPASGEPRLRLLDAGEEVAAIQVVNEDEVFKALPVHDLAGGPMTVASVREAMWYRERSTLVLQFVHPTNAPEDLVLDSWLDAFEMDPAPRFASFDWLDATRLEIHWLVPADAAEMERRARDGSFRLFSRSLIGVRQGKASFRVASPGDFELSIGARSRVPLKVHSCERHQQQLLVPTFPARETGFEVQGVIALDGEHSLPVPNDAIPSTFSLALWLNSIEEATGSHRALLFKGDPKRFGGHRTPSAWLLPNSNGLAVRVSSAERLDIGSDTPTLFHTATWVYLIFSVSPGGIDVYADGRSAMSLRFQNATSVQNDGPLSLFKDPERKGVVGYAADIRFWPERLVNAREAADLFHGASGTRAEIRDAITALYHEQAYQASAEERRKAATLLFMKAHNSTQWKLAGPRGNEGGQALALAHSAARLGDARAALMVSTRYARGWGGLPQSAEAAAWYARISAEIAHRQFHSPGHETFFQVDRLSDKRRERKEVAQRGEDDALLEAQVLRAERGDVNALVATADLLYWGGRGFQRDHRRSRSYLKRAAEAGHAHAQYLYASMLLRGEGGSANHSAAVLYYEKAANAGSLQALNGLGYEYFYGHAQPKNLTRAFKYFQRAALSLNPDGDSLYNCAHCLARGLGTNRNETAAAILYERAANQGHFDAAYELAAAAYASRKPQRALDYYTACAKAGWLAHDLRSGFDAYLRADYDEAFVWYAQAADFELSDVAAANAAWLQERGLTTSIRVSPVRFRLIAYALGDHAESAAAIGDAFAAGWIDHDAPAEAALKWYSQADTPTAILSMANLHRDLGTKTRLYDRALAKDQTIQMRAAVYIARARLYLIDFPLQTPKLLFRITLTLTAAIAVSLCIPPRYHVLVNLARPFGLRLFRPID